MFLVFNILDFYTTQYVIFSILYLGALSGLLLSIIFNKGKKIFAYFSKGFTSLVYFILFISLLVLLSYYYKKQIENNRISSQYTSIQSNTFLNEQLDFNETDAVSLRNRYEKETRLTSLVNIINAFKEKYAFEYDLTANLDSSKAPYSLYINSAKELYNSFEYRKIYVNHINKAVEYSKKITPKSFHLFPVEAQPKFISSLVIHKKTKYFASLAIGSKITILSFMLKTYNLIGYYGMILTLPVLILISFFLTAKTNDYNLKYNKESNNANNFFFIFISILGILITFITLE